MADRYWVGGGSSTNWSATGSTNWASSSGGANNQSVPTTTDNVFFDANSGSGASVISASIAVMKVDCTGFTGTITHNSGVTLTINTGTSASLIFSAAMTYTASAVNSLITFTHTSGTADITSNGKRMGALTINGVGGTTRLLDALRVDAASSSTITVTNGVFTANDFDVTAQVFSSTNSNVRTVTMGSGTWTVGGNVGGGVTVWNLATVTNLTFNKDTAGIVIPSNINAAVVRIFAGGGRTYNGLTIEASTQRGVVQFSGANTFSDMNISAGHLLQFTASTTTTITNAFSFAGTNTSPISIHSTTPGTAATLSVASGSCALDYGFIRDITASGGATFTAANAFDHGGNSGWVFSPPSAFSIEAIVAAVWDEPTAGNVTAGTFGAQLKTVLDAVDAKADAVKAKTDSLAFTVAGQVDANVQYVNDVQVNGTGAPGDRWGP
jgi:hypothetical protein